MANKFNIFTGRFDIVANKASEISIADAGSYYTGTEVETALQEIGAGTTLDSRYVNVTGDTMTGILTLSGDPVNALDAATKQYVDNNVPSAETLAATLVAGNVTGGTDIIVEDNDSIFFGTGSDSQLYYDGTNTIWDLTAVGSGGLQFTGDVQFDNSVSALNSGDYALQFMSGKVGAGSQVAITGTWGGATGAYFTLTNGNLTITHSITDVWTSARATVSANSGVVYYQVTIDSDFTTGGQAYMVGWGNVSQNLASYAPSNTNAIAFQGSGNIWYNNSVGPALGTTAIGDVLLLAYDHTNNEFHVWRQGGGAGAFTYLGGDTRKSSEALFPSWSSRKSTASTADFTTATGEALTALNAKFGVGVAHSFDTVNNLITGSKLVEWKLQGTVKAYIDETGQIISNGADIQGSNLLLDSAGTTYIDPSTDNQLDLYINDALDFQFTANTFTALVGSVIETDIINEVTAANGVSIDGVKLKDGGALVIKGGSDTFNLSNGTASLDVAASATINFDNDFVVDLDMTGIIDDDTMATASATTLATSESIKAYADLMLPLAGGTMTGDITLANSVSALNSGDYALQLQSGATGSGTPPSTADANIIAYWKFDDGSGTVAVDSVGANNGTLFSGATWSGSGAFGYTGDDSITFDGAVGYVDCGTAINPSAITKRSVQGWIKSPSAGTSDGVFGNWDTVGSQGFGLQTGIVTGNSFLVAVTNTGGDYGTVNYDISNWVHFCMVYDGTQTGNSNRLKLYLDGVNQTLAFTGTIPAITPTFSSILTIGKFSELGRFWNGQIDNIVIYDDVRTASEVLADYNNGMPSGTNYILDTATIMGTGSKLLSIRNNTVEKLYIDETGQVVSNGADIQGSNLVLDSAGTTYIDPSTDNQLDLYINDALDFQFTANTFTALSGSTIETNNISETIAGSGVTIDDELLTIGGRIKTTTRVTTTYTILTADEVVYCDTDGGAFTVTLPAGVDGATYKVVNCGTSGNQLTVAPDGAELLIGDNSNFILNDGETLNLTYETTEGWY